VVTTRTPLPEAVTLGEFAIVSGANARRLLTDAETLLTRGGWGSAYSLAVLAFEEAGKSWLCLMGLIMPDEIKAKFPFGELVASHRYKLYAARMIAPLLAFMKDGPQAAVASFIEAIDTMEDLAREDNLAKQRGIYADFADGVIWNPTQIRRDEARAMVAGVGDLLDRSAPIAEPGFLRFVATPPDDLRAEADTLMRRFIACAQADDLDGAVAVIGELDDEMDGLGEMFEQDARRLAAARRRVRSQPRKFPRAQRAIASRPAGR
jgi:AbiV family abortive infection protein